MVLSAGWCSKWFVVYVWCVCERDNQPLNLINHPSINNPSTLLTVCLG